MKRHSIFAMPFHIKIVDFDVGSSGTIGISNMKFGEFMSLNKITDLTNQFGISSRSLRYYEQVGLIKSVRPDFEKYRFFDDKNVERLKQIMVLRKMQISIKDIIRIYESDDMSVVVETFVDRINAINEEVNALSEMKRITNEFLHTMIKNGIKKISALPLLYEEMEKEMNEARASRSVSFNELSEASEKLVKPPDFSIVDLPPMRVLTSFRKPGTKESDFSGFLRYIQINGLSQAASGSHQQFEFQTEAGDVLMVRVPEDFINGSEYLDYTFDGGLFATVNLYLDEDLGQCFRALVHELDTNPYYQFAYCTDGTSRHPTLLENLISPDDKRELVAMLIPVKKRLPNPVLFDKPKEVTNITVAEIEQANPVLWDTDVPLDKLTQTHPQNSYFRINDNGEAEYIGWIIRAVLNTDVSVKLPFRIDMEFRQSGKGKTGIVFYYGEDTGYPSGRIGNRGFGVNMSNDNEKMIQAIRFSQPVFGDDFHFPGRGAIKTDEPNRLTWIVGEKHLAVIINDEVRYCGVNFPYMSLDLNREEVCPIVIGAHGNDMIYFRSLRISQLAEAPINKVRKGELTMITKQSNNIIPVIHRLVTDEYGENYWFNGCARYVMECLGEKDYDYWFFAGITGDIFTQHYAYTKSYWDAIDGYRLAENPKQFVKDTFAKCGYAATYVFKQEIRENAEMYLNTLTAYIDKGIPIINLEEPSGVFVGYEEYGKILLCITGNNNQPERLTVDDAIKGRDGWIFVGEKKENHPLSEIYRKAIKAIPQYFSEKTDDHCFGAEAFRAWANDIENGKFDGMPIEEFDTWFHHTNYVCILATNSGCNNGFLRKAQELNPDFVWMEDIIKLYNRTGQIWNNDNGNDLEALGGGFNVTLEVLQDKNKRSKIAAKIRECADCMDKVVEIINANIKNE